MDTISKILHMDTISKILQGWLLLFYSTISNILSFLILLNKIFEEER